MPRLRAQKQKTAGQQMNEAHWAGTREWHEVRLLADDGSAILRVEMLWSSDEAALFKQFSEKMTVEVCRRVQTCEPI